MSIVTIASILITFCALFSFINYQFIKLPTTIGIMAMALVLSIVVLFLPALGFDVLPEVRALLGSVDFSEALLHGMLSFLLFAGALHVDLVALKKQKYIISILAFLGTLFSTIAVGVLVYYVFPAFGFNIPLIYALLFGALISPTDPVAVMAIMRKAGVTHSLETKVVGESLLNDGIAVVIFLSLLGVVTHGDPGVSDVVLLFARESIGGAVLGLALGWAAFYMLRSVDNYQVEILLTLALVMGGYELARLLHTSGPIAIVVAGIITGNNGRAHAMSQKTKENLDNFWELVDEFLNAVLFLLIGFELLLVEFNPSALVGGLFMIPALLVVRYVSVAAPVKIFSRYRSFSPGAVNILTWGGLRGGLSVALVLSLPMGETRDFLLLVTYCVVVFSILIQGLTVGRLARFYKKA